MFDFSTGPCWCMERCVVDHVHWRYVWLTIHTVWFQHKVLERCVGDHSYWRGVLDHLHWRGVWLTVQTVWFQRKVLESKISEGQVFIEFEEIPKRAAQLECSVAKATHNQSRNRFKDVLPYDTTRVKLSARKDNPDGYINASHVKVPQRGHSSLKVKHCIQQQDRTALLL